MGITPRALAELLGIRERVLTDWRVRGWIPDLDRVARRVGTGRGAYYEWPDREIIAHVATIDHALRFERGRMETAGILAWFTGFDVPRADIRDLWARFENLPWQKARRWAQADEDEPDQDVVNALVAEYRHQQHKKKSGYPDEVVELIARMSLDPSFDFSTRPLGRRTAKILAGNDVPMPFKVAAWLCGLPVSFTDPVFGDDIYADDLQLLPADVVRGLAIVKRDYWSSAPRLIEVIRAIPDDTLIRAHADVRFLLSPYRAWLESVMSTVASATDPDLECSDLEESLLRFGPRLAWMTGRQLLKLDIALRRLGCGGQVDETIAMLQELTARDEIRQAASLFMRDWEAKVSPYESAPGALAPQDTWTPVPEGAAAILQSIGLALKNLWLPRLKLALAEAAGEGAERPLYRLRGVLPAPWWTRARSRLGAATQAPAAMIREDADPCDLCSHRWDEADRRSGAVPVRQVLLAST
jgi:hypothetical protein